MNADRRSDVEYWGLTWREQVDYFGRLSAYYGRRSAAYGERAARLWRSAQRLHVVFAVLMALLALLFGGKLAGWWA